MYCSKSSPASLPSSGAGAAGGMADAALRFSSPRVGARSKFAEDLASASRTGSFIAVTACDHSTKLAALASSGP
eukprot:scaffold39946_cov48-Phaeocystis_antarctica.AAC.2